MTIGELDDSLFLNYLRYVYSYFIILYNCQFYTWDTEINQNRDRAKKSKTVDKARTNNNKNLDKDITQRTEIKIEIPTIAMIIKNNSLINKIIKIVIKSDNIIGLPGRTR